MIKVQFACGCLMTITDCGRDKYDKNYICPVHRGKEKKTITYFCIECGEAITTTRAGLPINSITGSTDRRCVVCADKRNFEERKVRYKRDREFNKRGLLPPVKKRAKKDIITRRGQNKYDCEHYGYCLSKYAHDPEWQHNVMPCKFCQKYKKGSLDIMNHVVYESDAGGLDYSMRRYGK
jgi:DNA-directed RNA polymerase subunit RPC12/RpoP